MKHFGKWYEVEYVVKQNEVKKRMLDFSECSYTGKIYLTTKNELELPDWPGNNLDALWDTITGIMSLILSIANIDYVCNLYLNILFTESRVKLKKMSCLSLIQTMSAGFESS